MNASRKEREKREKREKPFAHNTATIFVYVHCASNIIKFKYFYYFISFLPSLVLMLFACVTRSEKSTRETIFRFIHRAKKNVWM